MTKIKDNAKHIQYIVDQLTERLPTELNYRVSMKCGNPWGTQTLQLVNDKGDHAGGVQVGVLDDETIIKVMSPADKLQGRWKKFYLISDAVSYIRTDCVMLDTRSIRRLEMKQQIHDINARMAQYRKRLPTAQECMHLTEMIALVGDTDTTRDIQRRHVRRFRAWHKLKRLIQHKEIEPLLKEIVDNG